MKKLIFILSLVLFIGCSGLSQKNMGIIAFYNVENLFDTINQAHNDEEFLPNGRHKWTSQRYQDKIQKLNQVIDSMGAIILLGLCEIENKQVIKDLNQASSYRKNFGIVHYESADARGIDVGMIYDPSILTLKNSGFIRFEINNGASSTRDIVWAKFVHKKDTLFAIVNHWPSRLGGVEMSEPKRLKAAETVSSFIDSIITTSPTSKIIFMGDLNDNPTNKSVQMIAERLTPIILKSSGKFGGTYSYKNEWNISDYIFVSPNVFSGNFNFIEKSGKIISNDFLVRENNGIFTPKRGANGYSDHLPVVMDVVFK
jgi:predicted extracellular nuclease